MTQAKQGDNVKIHYTGKLKDGTVFDSSEGREPLEFTIGSGMVIPGFEEAVVGMNQGETKEVTIPVDKAYGPRNEELIMEFKRDQFPPHIEPELNQRLQLGAPNGQLVVVTVVDISGDTVKLDANPPLAGQDLIFNLELVEIA